jgi:hypothetical protein
MHWRGGACVVDHADIRLVRILAVHGLQLRIRVISALVAPEILTRNNQKCTRQQPIVQANAWPEWSYLRIRLHSRLDCASMVVLYIVRPRIEVIGRLADPVLVHGFTQRLKETGNTMLIGEHELPKASSV